jgi:hypothetical protein
LGIREIRRRALDEVRDVARDARQVSIERRIGLRFRPDESLARARDVAVADRPAAALVAVRMRGAGLRGA